MAKLTMMQKDVFAINKEMMDSDFLPYAFLFNREAGISVMAVYTGNGRKHVKIAVSYCSPHDEFKKKIGFTECIKKLIDNDQGVIIPAKGVNICYCLGQFINRNFPDIYNLEML